MHPITRLWIKILIAFVEVGLLLVGAMAIGGTVPSTVGAVALTLIFVGRMFYITGGIGGYASYRAHAKEVLRGKSDHHRP